MNLLFIVLSLNIPGMQNKSRARENILEEDQLSFIVLSLQKIEWGKKVFIKSGNGTTINCYYHIWADRLGEKLIVEYQGETPDDYPGDNSEYSIAGWTYDKRNSWPELESIIQTNPYL